MLLFATLFGSIISIFTEAKYKLKDAIQEVLEKNKEKVFSGQELLDALRDGRYKSRNELISLHVIQIALREMDIEYREDAPKATICEHNHFIPRWNDNYEEHVLKTVPSILFLRTSSKENMEEILLDLKGEKKKSEALLAYISEKSSLSIELLKDGNVLDRKLQQFVDKYYVSNKDPTIYIAYSENAITKIYIHKEISIELFKEIIRDLEKLTWFDRDIEEKITKELLIEFTEKVLLDQPNAFYKKMRDDFLEMLKKIHLNDVSTENFDSDDRRQEERFD